MKINICLLHRTPTLIEIEITLVSWGIVTLELSVHSHNPNSIVSENLFNGSVLNKTSKKGNGSNSVLPVLGDMSSDVLEVEKWADAQSKEKPIEHLISTNEVEYFREFKPSNKHLGRGLYADQ